VRREVNRASAPWKGREQCSRVRRRGGRRKRSAGRPGAANGLPQLPDSVTVVLVQHSLRGAACQRFGVSSVGLDSTIGPSLPLAISARSCGQGSAWEGGCRCVPFRVEFAMALSWSLRGRNRARPAADRAARRAAILVCSEQTCRNPLDCLGQDGDCLSAAPSGHASWQHALSHSAAVR
jgi:hypothetical protein